MYNITSDEIRNIFIEYFQSREHLRISGASVIPKNDPTLLYINSGMAPLKKFFTGEDMPPAKNLCNIQPCIRTIDIDEIGDRHHLTSFEMLGSWSFNNYFKKDAIPLAFRLLTEGLKIPKEKLYATVFEGSKELKLGMDQEAIDIWKSLGLEADHIVPQPFEDNFWGPTAETGPCGPCTEVFYDTGEEFGDAYVPDGEFDTKHRYIEIWNAGVFMQFNKTEKGTYESLKFKSVDTGAGLERLTMTLNKLGSVYEIDSLKPIVELIEREFEKAGVTTEDKEKDIHVLTDHLRTVTILLATGIQPSNTGREYIPRRLIRKCCTIVYKYNISDFSYNGIIDKVIVHYAKYYDHFEPNREHILKVFHSEVDSYLKILHEGVERVEKICKRKGDTVSGKDAFILVTTYGLPFDLLKEYVAEYGKTIDETDYNAKVLHHKEISRQTSENGEDDPKINAKKLQELDGEVEAFEKTKFLGYDQLSCQAKCIFLDVNGGKAEVIAEGQKACVLFDESCFYAESGGQIADTGFISNGIFKAKVFEVKKVKDRFVHFIQVESGSLMCGDRVDMTVDKERRHQIEANHTSVHLLQQALRGQLGEEVKQAGSLVTDERLRFDFYYDNKIEEDSLNEIELNVNKFIQMNLEREVTVSTYEEAIEEGALAFFQNKYGSDVRLVKFDNVSKELCGGTHIQYTGRIGMFKIVSEESVGRGIRRITAVTGTRAVKMIQQELMILKNVSRKLKVDTDKIIDKIDSLEKRKQIVKEEKDEVLSKEDIAKLTKQSNNNSYMVYHVKDFSDNVRDEAVRVADAISGISCFYAISDDKVKIVVSVAKKLSKDISASNILKKAVSFIDGKGGGSPHLAMGSGDNVEGTKELESKFGTLI